MAWHPSAHGADPTLGASLLGQSCRACQPDPQGRGPFIRGGYVLSWQCSSSIVPAHAPKLIRGSEMPTCPTQFSPARLGMQQSCHAATPRPARSAFSCSGSCVNQGAGPSGYPCSCAIWPQNTTTQRRVLGSSQNHSHPLQQLSSAREPPAPTPCLQVALGRSDELVTGSVLRLTGSSEDVSWNRWGAHPS